jgi:hypothetical protein
MEEIIGLISIAEVGCEPEWMRGARRIHVQGNFAHKSFSEIIHSSPEMHAYEMHAYEIHA